MASLLTELRELVPNRPLLLSEAESYAELQATRLLRANRITAPPVPEAIATRLTRVEVRHESRLPTLAATHWMNGRWVIVLDASQPRVRQRWSLFHELKHCLDHPRAEMLYPNTLLISSEERAEQTADYFAACVLIPRRWLLRAWDDGIRDVTALMRIFKVSKKAMQYRMRVLRLREPEDLREAA